MADPRDEPERKIPNVGAVLDFIYEHECAGAAVVILVSADGHTGVDDFKRHVAELALRIERAVGYGPVVAIIGGEPPIGVPGVPVAHFSMFPSLDAIDAEQSGCADLERGYQ